MGNTTSVAERIHRASKGNDVMELQGLCRDMRLNGALDTSTRKQWLNHTDLEGRTALHWAAQKNYLQVAQILLEQGADVHTVAPKRPNGGSPLAEAVAGKHEAMVDLLLRHGADPFTENPAGKNPFDLALELRATNIIRSFEKLTLFSGYVNVKVLQLKGFSHAAKDRWVVIAPRFTPPTNLSGSVGVVRVMMLLYRNAAEAEPRTKLWLDGATIYRAGQEAVLRLHPNHEQPRNAFTKYDQGWQLFFRQAQSGSAPVTAATPVPDTGSSVAGAAAAFAVFLAVCARPLDHLQAQQQQRANSGSSSNPFIAPAGVAPQAAAADPSYNPFTIGTASLSAPNVWRQHQIASAAPAAWQQQQQPGGRTVSSSGSPTRQQQQQQYYYGGGRVQAAGAPPAAAQRPSGGIAAANAGGTGVAAAGGAADIGDFGLMAAPGESDEDFARRLANLYGCSPSRQTTAPPTAAPSTASSRANSVTQQQQSMAAAAAGSGGALYPTLPPRMPSGSDAAPSAPGSNAAPGFAADNPFRPTSAGNTYLPYPAGSAAAAAAGGYTQAPASAPGSASEAAGSISQAHSVGAGSGSSLPAGPASGGTGSSSDSSVNAEAELCVICLSNPREVGFLHGASVHKCVCRECAQLVQPGTPCPMCRQAIERVIGVY